jgi:DNA-binding PadR family transcriptional regulator
MTQPVNLTALQAIVLAEVQQHDAPLWGAELLRAVQEQRRPTLNRKQFYVILDALQEKKLITSTYEEGEHHRFIRMTHAGRTALTHFRTVVG